MPSDSTSNSTRRAFLAQMAAVAAAPLLFRAQSALGMTADAKLSDDELLETVQRQTFKYFWEFAHEDCGLAREGSGHAPEIVTVGGAGFGLMAMLVAAERKWVTRDEVVARYTKILDFLSKAERFHGVFPHWMNGNTGKVYPFSPKDDGADLVETSFLIHGLLCARQYFNGDNPAEKNIREQITQIWHDVDWNWHTQSGKKVLYWHWSPKNGWGMNHEIRGWNECLITYVLAASSPTHPIDADVYHEGWAKNNSFKNGNTYYGTKMPLGSPMGGPVFFTHYSFLGLDPRGLKDRYADYWEQNVAHSKINYAYCVDNPKKFKGYGENCWGLTASVSVKGYEAHSPTNDRGVIAPTAALSCMPYTPKESMAALRHFYEDLGPKLWKEYGFRDAFSEQHDWVADTFLAIDQGPIIVMIENHRTGLLWKLFMQDTEVLAGLKKLEFTTASSKG
jgi:hypothetical protein